MRNSGADGGRRGRRRPRLRVHDGRRGRRARAGRPELRGRHVAAGSPTCCARDCAPTGSTTRRLELVDVEDPEALHALARSGTATLTGSAVAARLLGACGETLAAAFVQVMPQRLRARARRRPSRGGGDGDDRPARVPRSCSAGWRRTGRSTSALARLRRRQRPRRPMASCASRRGGAWTAASRSATPAARSGT